MIQYRKHFLSVNAEQFDIKNMVKKTPVHLYL